MSMQSRVAIGSSPPLLSSIIIYTQAKVGYRRRRSNILEIGDCFHVGA